jgi:hypothetical protein
MIIINSLFIEQRIKYHKYLLVSECLKNEAPVNFFYKSQRQKLNFLRKLLHTLDQSYGMNFCFAITRRDFFRSLTGFLTPAFINNKT